VTLVKRRRKFRPLSLSGRELLTYNGGVISDGRYNMDIAEHQITWSEGHPGWKKARGTQNVGGPFETVRTRYRANYDLNQDYSFGSGGVIRYNYTGKFHPDIVPPRALYSNATDEEVLAFVPSLGDPILGARGATAISDCAPTNPVADTSVNVAELIREGLPSLVGSTLVRGGPRNIGQSIGGEYLNLQFGILPLWSAIQDTAKAVIESDQVVKQLLRDSGKNVRRHYKFPTTVDMAETVYQPQSLPWPTLTLNHWNNSGVAPVTHIRTERSVWFDGCFTYYLPPESMEGLEGAANKARLVYGVKFTPDVIWNLLGWSWLVDWAVNVGPVMNNLGLFSRDGLTLRYGYTMEKTNVTRTTSFPGLAPAGYGSLPKNPTFVLHGERKRRLEQSPFVLGLTDSQFTARRAAILTALGLTRMR